MKKLTAATLSTALLLLSPGLPCYQAFAAEFTGPGSKGEVVPVVAPLPQALTPLPQWFPVPKFSCRSTACRASSKVPTP